MVKGKTKSGIKFNLDERIKDDARLLYLLTSMQDESIEPQERSKYVFKLIKMIFGSEEGVMTFMDEVSARHDGVCDVASMLTELNDMFEALNAKNS